MIVGTNTFKSYNQSQILVKMAECFSCISPRLRKDFHYEYDDDSDSEVEDHRDEGEQETTQDEIRDEPSPSNQSSRNYEFVDSEKGETPLEQTELEQTEPKPTSKQDEILRKLGILYLDEKVTRARAHDSETDNVILREAGVYFVDEPKKQNEEEKSKKMEEFKQKISNNTISERDAKILKESGVLSFDGFSITKDEPITQEETHLETIEYKSPSVTTSDSTTLASGSVNSSYADRKLRRRLRKGWTLTGRECMCGMPVIFLKGSYECVICGVVGDDTFCDEEQGTVQEVESHMVGGSPGVFLLSSDTNMSTLPSVDQTDQTEEAMRAELGQRLFSGWVMLGTSCPNCSLPLIGNNGDTPAACVRCDKV